VLEERVKVVENEFKLQILARLLK